MKKILSVLMILSLLFAFTACRQNPAEDDSAASRQTSAPAEETEPPATEPAGDAPTEAPTEAPTAETDDADAFLAPVNQYLPAGETRTEEDWLRAAADAYQTACETFFTYRESSAWLAVDYSAPAISEHYFKVTNFESKAEAEAEFFSVFSYRGFATALDEKLIEKDGVLYAAITDRGADESYEGFEITEIQAVGDGEITFLVVNRHIEGLDPQTFTLRYERDAYRVDYFILPY